MRKSLLIVVVLIVSVIVSYFLWRDRLERGQVVITPAPTTRPASRLSPEIAKALDRRLPEDFSCAGGLQKTLHRMGDETRTQIFLDLLYFRQHGVREDMPIRARLGGKTLREALKIVQSQSDPPLWCDTAGEIVLIGPPQFEWTLRYSPPNYDVHLLASTPAEEQQLIADIQRRMDSCPWLAPARPERWPMTITKGTLTTGEDRVLPRYELMRYLNRRHARVAMWDFAGRTGLLCAGSLALLGVNFFIQWRLRERRRRREGLCRRCGYDLRASTERCPECGLAFG